MRVSINSEARTVERGISLARLLEELELPPRRVAVEVNRELVRRADYQATRLQEGDRIEIVTFVGGG